MMDDEPFLGEIMKMMLQPGLPNAEILTFTSAECALQELERHTPDLFTTDYNHPHHKCEEMLKLLGAKKAKCPVIVISASAESLRADGRLEEYASKLGLNFKLWQKPISPEQLRQELANLVGSNIRLNNCEITEA